MPTTQKLKNMAAVLIMAASCSSLAGVGSELEATAGCSEAGCLQNMTSAAPSFQTMLQNVNIISKDNRQPVISSNQDHASGIVGYITTNQSVPSFTSPGQLVKAQSTAFMVSPCHALTNFHAVFGNASHGDAVHTVSLTINGSKKYSGVIGTPVAWGANTDSSDWTLLKLSKCVGLDPKIGWGIPASSALKNVTMAGFPGDRDLTHVWTSACQLHEPLPNGVVTHDCASVERSSGSPIYTTSGSGLPQIEAINVGEIRHVNGVVKTYSASAANIGITFSSIYPSIQYYTNDAINHFKNIQNPQITMATKPQVELVQATSI